MPHALLRPVLCVVIRSCYKATALRSSKSFFLHVHCILLHWPVRNVVVNLSSWPLLSIVLHLCSPSALSVVIDLSSRPIPDVVIELSSRPILNVVIDLSTRPRSGELRTQKLKSHLVRTQSLNVLPLKPGVGQYIAIHARLTARDSFPANFYPSDPSTCIFSETSSDLFYCVGCG